ncbi:murein hydrolase activator EnvC family protein [Desulfotalea psychrophila]|uniref:Related to lipoprotein NlpD/LppB n=1 Tax=Desulfotalea psychrophila (strain LSv54 / DSM 12343) TaxID=177439 RepID=Q6AK42_DESPS|nr:peptidoglycan DD-metalloendopeptidase family protein [Desulfotalea psychrophila]CAG37284.1 related to lipoprotein NlpD/LppB [Desulfotalea psychrophila LSv54]
MILHIIQLNRYRTSAAAGPQARHLLLVLSLLCLLANIMLLPLAAEATDHQPLLQEKKKQIETNLDRLQRGIRKQQEAIITEDRQETDILTELETLNERIGKKEVRINALQGQIIAQKRKTELKEKALLTLHRQNSSLRTQLAKRIRAYYMTGQIGFLNIAFSAKSFSELLSFRDSFDVLIHYDEELLNNYSRAIKKLKSSKKALLLEQEILQSFFTEVGQEKQEAQADKDKKETILARTRTQKQLHAEAVKEMLGSQQQLSTSLVSIKRKQARRENRFLSRKGQLEAPVAGTIITQFLEKSTNRMGIAETSMGIAIEAADGSPVIATEAGKVLSAGYLQGSGNTVIIHHGFQYYTITSRLENIATKKGAQVRPGDIIGRAGDTATLIDAGLYFEIRHGKKSIDPLSWLKPTVKTAQVILPDGPRG